MTSTGLIPSPPDDRDYPVSAVARDVSLPSKVLMDESIYKVLDQGFCGTCVGKAGNGILSAAYEKALSSLYIYTLCKERDGIPYTQGTYPRVAMKVMQKLGSCPEKHLPYERLKTCTILPVISDSMVKAAADYTVGAYSRLWDISEIKRALANGCLVMGAVWVTDNWMHYQGGRILPGDEKKGGHAVVFTGYDDDRGAIRGLNSWGTSWGEDGFFWLDYACLETEFIEAWAVEVPAPPPEEDIVDKIMRLLLELLQKLDRIFRR